MFIISLAKALSIMIFNTSLSLSLLHTNIRKQYRRKFDVKYKTNYVMNLKFIFYVVKRKEKGTWYMYLMTR